MPRKKTTKKVAPKKAEKVSRLTYLGAGSLSGEYLFKEIPGSITAGSYEEACKKATHTINHRQDLNFSS